MENSGDPEGDKIAIARQAIIEWVERERMSLPVTGNIAPCPVCGRGELEFFVFDNGDIHGKCSALVPRCVEWSE